MKGVYIFLADGFEETEALAPYDMLVRAGVPVKTVCLNDDNFVTSSHRVPMLAELNFGEFLHVVETEGTSAEDVMIFPGGMPGSSNLAANEVLMKLMNAHYAEGGAVAAICAAPALVLASKMKEGTLAGKEMTCYAGMEAPIPAAGASYRKTGVITDGRVITASGAGHAVAFGLEIVAYLKDRQTADKIAAAIML
ncbi:MAG: DJ-1/PfpI family protein [Bacteroidales bacterium]|nr:DJ-1/PfpI family protein [Bacteroidales bacterium]